MSSLLMNKKLATLFVSQMTLGTAVRAKSSEVLNRAGLAKIVAQEHELTLTKADKIVKTVFDSIVKKVADKGIVRIGDFGKFYSFHSEARTYKVPKTGDKIDKPAVERPKFMAFDKFKKSANKE